MVAKMRTRGGVEWDDVRIFLTLFRERSLSAAAGRLGVDPSTVSRRVAALEAALGVRLFDRTRDGVTPLETAELLLPAAEQAEAGHLHFALDASTLEGEVEGVVRLSVPPGVADDFVGPALPRLHAQYPKLRIELDASVRVVDLTRREADIALRTIRPQSGDLVMTKVAETRWVAMACKSYSEELGRVGSWRDARWIDWGEDLRGIGPARWYDRHVGIPPVLRTSHFATLLSAVEHGLGVALVPTAYSKPRRLVELAYAKPLRASAAEWPVDETWLVGHRALRSVPRIAAVWNFMLAEIFAQAPAGARAKSDQR